MLYTDGITEAEDDHGEPYGLERLIAAVRRSRAGSAAAICDEVLQDVRRHAGAQPQDDQTLVVLQAI